MFLDGGWEGRRSWTEWYHDVPEFYLLVTSLWIWCWFVTVLFKFLNLVTFCGFITILSNALITWFDILYAVNLLLNKSHYCNLIITVPAYASHSCFHPKMTGINTDASHSISAPLGFSGHINMHNLKSIFILSHCFRPFWTTNSP